MPHGAVVVPAGQPGGHVAGAAASKDHRYVPELAHDVGYRQQNLLDTILSGIDGVGGIRTRGVGGVGGGGSGFWSGTSLVVLVVVVL